MFVSREMIGGWIGDNIPAIPKKKQWSDLLAELRGLQIKSSTWLMERRALIRSWTPDELVRAHTALRAQIIQQWVLTYGDKVLLQAMKQEWVESWWFHTQHIWVYEVKQIPHGQWLTTINNQWEQVAWFTRLWVWKVLSE